MTTIEILALIKSKIRSDYKAISIDGSAFDSSQFEALMRCVDDTFWRFMQPYVRKII